MSRRIAIVEDEPAIRANYTEALRKHGFEVSAYAARAEALTAMRTRLPDLALIDIGLGADVDGGFALCRELRALSAALPIIFLPRGQRLRPPGRPAPWPGDYLTKDVSCRTDGPHRGAFSPRELSRNRPRAPSASSAVRCARLKRSRHLAPPRGALTLTELGWCPPRQFPEQ